MSKNVKWFVAKGMLIKTQSTRAMAPKYLEKSRNNLVLMDVLSDLQTNIKAREILHISSDFDVSEWIIICAYYAMYMAASAALAAINYRSKNHSATIVSLDTFFVKKEMLESEFLEMINNAKFEKEQIWQLDMARNRRETAQYSVTKLTTKTMAEKTRKDAYEFVERIEELYVFLSKKS